VRVDRCDGIDGRVADIECTGDHGGHDGRRVPITVIVTSSPAFVKKPRSFA